MKKEKEDKASRLMFNYVLERMNAGDDTVKVSDLKDYKINGTNIYDSSAFGGMLKNGVNKNKNDGSLGIRYRIGDDKGRYKPAFIKTNNGNEEAVTIPERNLIECNWKPMSPK